MKIPFSGINFVLFHLVEGKQSIFQWKLDIISSFNFNLIYIKFSAEVFNSTSFTILILIIFFCSFNYLLYRTDLPPEFDYQYPGKNSSTLKTYSK